MYLWENLCVWKKNLGSQAKVTIQQNNMARLFFGLRGRSLDAALIWTVIMPAYILWEIWILKDLSCAIFAFLFRSVVKAKRRDSNGLLIHELDLVITMRWRVLYWICLLLKLSFRVFQGILIWRYDFIPWRCCWREMIADNISRDQLLLCMLTFVYDLHIMSRI